jgi:hypothetical protein
MIGVLALAFILLANVVMKFIKDKKEAAKKPVRRRATPAKKPVRRTTTKK